MTRRGYRHASPLEESLATGRARQELYVDTPEEQVRILREKGCDCRVVG
jgi:hypothetical protein